MGIGGVPGGGAARRLRAAARVPLAGHGRAPAPAWQSATPEPVFRMSQLTPIALKKV